MSGEDKDKPTDEGPCREPSIEVQCLLQIETSLDHLEGDERGGKEALRRVLEWAVSRYVGMEYYLTSNPSDE